jgi:hypothetical protein
MGRRALIELRIPGRAGCPLVLQLDAVARELEGPAPRSLMP